MNSTVSKKMKKYLDQTIELQKNDNQSDQS
jgi:hypothetical protein